jgi:dipeptidyl aminopeptidase/acylaminoacyl peptidase
MQALSFVNSDGMNVHGYFTKALGVKDKTAPMVVLVHGGPHGVRDYWGFRKSVQALATNGYSVLQVNYRGSDGYGKKFAEAGYQHWGDDIQQDIIQATHWAVEQKLAKAGNICIMGSSFGAYSAVQSATIEADLYQCVIATAGVYDLNLLDEKGDIKSLYFADSFLQRVIGTDKEALSAMSPVNYAEKLKASIFLAHGNKDERAPIIHAEKLMEALDKHNKAYQWLKIDDESHGFYDEENQQEYLNKVLEFLGKNLQSAH